MTFNYRMTFSILQVDFIKIKKILCMKLLVNLFFLRKWVGEPLRPYLQGLHFIPPFVRSYPKRFLYKKDFNLSFHLED